MWAYNSDTNMWIAQPSMNIPRAEFLLKANDERLFAFGDNSDAETLEMFSVADEQWTLIAIPDEGLSCTGALVLESRIYAFGCDDDNGKSRKISVIDAQGEVKVLEQELPKKISGCACVLLKLK